MIAKNEELVRKVFCNVLESLAFLFPRPVAPGELPPAPAEALRADINFTGEKHGSFSLAAPMEMCAEAAGNMMGGEGGDPEQAADALREMLNVFCGQYLTASAGPGPVFDLSVPRTTPMDQAEWLSFQNDPKTICFEVDEWPALLQASTD